MEKLKVVHGVMRVNQIVKVRKVMMYCVMCCYILYYILLNFLLLLKTLVIIIIGSCNGNWCTTGAPTAPTPGTLSPTADPTYAPSDSPTRSLTSQPTQCTDNPKDKFFLKMKNGSPKFKTCRWLAKKKQHKINRLCTKKTKSKMGIGPPKDICKAICGTCPTSSPTQLPTKAPSRTPTEPITSSPVKSPTKAPSKKPTSVTNKPTSSPVSGSVCCSQFFNVCKDNPWCQESEENCTTCNGVFLPNLPLQCIPRFGMCTDNEDGCCYPSTCVSGNSGTAKQCMYSPK